jgi:hypothetical protein
MTNCTMVFHFLRFLNIVIFFSEFIKSHTDIRKLLKVTQISELIKVTQISQI